MKRALRRRWLAVALTSVCASFLTACNPFEPNYNFRYRITVEVDTPQGVRTGSSVWESRASPGSGIPDSSISTGFSGEAVAVDLPGGTLFALLKPPSLDGDYAVGVVSSQYRANHRDVGKDPVDGWKEVRSRVQADRSLMTLEPRFYPLLARFGDLRKPASVQRVEPADLSTSFGPGVRLRRITVQVTKDRVTRGDIEKRLPWLVTHHGALLDSGNTPVSQLTFPALVNDSDLRSE